MHFLVLAEKSVVSKYETILRFILTDSNKIDRTTIFYRKKLEKPIRSFLNVYWKQIYFCKKSFIYGRYCSGDRMAGQNWRIYLTIPTEKTTPEIIHYLIVQTPATIGNWNFYWPRTKKNNLEFAEAQLHLPHPRSIQPCIF